MARNLKHSVQLNFWPIRVKQNKKVNKRNCENIFWRENSYETFLVDFQTVCIVGRIEELASTAAQREEGPFLKWLYSGIYVPWHCKTQIFIHDSMQYSASKKFLQLFGVVVAELRVHFCWQPSTQKNDIMIFQTNWILIFIQPSQKWIIKQFASCQNVSQVGITLFKDIFKGANSCQWCSFGQGYEYGKRGTFLYSKRVDLNLQWDEEGHRQVLILQFSFTYSETISYWSLGCRDSHVRGVGGQPDVSDLGCEARSCYHLV